MGNEWYENTGAKKRRIKFKASSGRTIGSVFKVRRGGGELVQVDIRRKSTVTRGCTYCYLLELQKQKLNYISRCLFYCCSVQSFMGSLHCIALYYDRLIPHFIPIYYYFNEKVKLVGMPNSSCGEWVRAGEPIPRPLFFSPWRVNGMEWRWSIG